MYHFKKGRWCCGGEYSHQFLLDSEEIHALASRRNESNWLIKIFWIIDSYMYNAQGYFSKKKPTLFAKQANWGLISLASSFNFIFSVIPSTYQGMQWASSLPPSFALHKRYDEIFHTEKVWDWLIGKNICFLATRLTWTCTVTNYEIAGSSVRQVGEYFKFLLSLHHSVFLVVFKKWCWALYRRYYGKFHGGSGFEPGDAWRDVKDLGRRQVFCKE